MSKTKLKKEEYVISTPKTVTESVTLTKQLLSIMLTEIIYSRKIFKNLNYVEKYIFGVPVKVMKCTNSPEEHFAKCLKLATSELQTKNLESLKIIVVAKEEEKAIEEYCIRFLYNEDNGIGVDMSQGDFSLLNCTTKNSDQMRKAISEVLKNESNFLKSVEPLPDKFFIKMQLTYYKEAPKYDPKYFTEKPVPKNELKDSSTKVKLGKIEKTFGSLLVSARSLLVKHETTTDDDMKND